MMICSLSTSLILFGFSHRTRLEEAIQAEEPTGLGIPVVVVLLEGGLGALGKCAMALKKNIPVVVVGGTGRAADLLAYAVSMTVRTARWVGGGSGKGGG